MDRCCTGYNRVGWHVFPVCALLMGDTSFLPTVALHGAWRHNSSMQRALVKGRGKGGGRGGEENGGGRRTLCTKRVTFFSPCAPLSQPGQLSVAIKWQPMIGLETHFRQGWSHSRDQQAVLNTVIKVGVREREGGGGEGKESERGEERRTNRQRQRQTDRPTQTHREKRQTGMDR